MREIRLRNQLDELPGLEREIDVFAESNGVGDEERKALHLVLEELVTNVIRHGYDDGGEHEIVIRLDLADSTDVLVEVEDGGRAFDPTRALVPHAGSSKGKGAVGGRGVGLVRRLVDDLSYERVADRNVLTLRMPGRSDPESRG